METHTTSAPRRWPPKKTKRKRRQRGRRLQRNETPVGTGIYNPSGIPLSNDETRVASTKNLNRFQTYVSLQKYIRNLNMKKYFLAYPIKNVAPVRVNSTLRNKSIFNSLNADNKFLEVFKNMVSKDVDGLKVKKLTDPQYIKGGMEPLEKRKEIVIRPTDKGESLVVLSKEYYQAEINHLLSDSDSYKILNKDPMLQLKDKLLSIIADGKAQRILTKKEAAYLDLLFGRTPIIYFLSKIHKDSVNPPGSPIINGIASISARLG